ncbi:response regulator [Roseateles sp.]|jgi:CheY-like chemotaxis protein|uniref:response regulator n=1 Tax=Roseateles sp. TaxID=1971397 RepID=UPI0037C700CA
MSYASSTSAASSLRVLVADDMPLNLRAAAALLKALGHGGALVTDGQKALNALAQQAFDLVLLDVSMPGLSGLDVLREIRAKELKGGPRMPVIIVSGHDLPEDRDRFLEAGADGVLVKPLQRIALSAEVQRVLTASKRRCEC